jgi:hypothetical protein
MRKEFTAISAFSTVLAFTAGAVICMQVSQMEAQPGADISVPVLWAIEAAIFGTAVYVWQSQVTVPGWILGIAGLIGVRTAVVSVAALMLAVMQETANVAACLQETSQLVPRVCAMGFALMVCYPLRVFLPMRAVEVRRRGRGFADSAAVKSATAGAEEGDRGLLIVTVKDRASAERTQPRPQSAEPIADLMPAPGIEGDVELPLSSVLALFPDDILTDKALALSDTGSLAIPLEVIHPQLKEAQVVFSVADLRSCLPPAIRKALVQSADSDLEVENTLVVLPLALIVPQLPPEAFELPPPSPPPWADVEAAEGIVFATT